MTKSYIINVFGLLLMSLSLMCCTIKATDDKSSSELPDTTTTKLVELETNDLRMLGLQGSVKSMDDERGIHWEFGADGLLQNVSDGLQRDSEGRIVTMIVDGIERSYTWDDENRLASDSGGGMKNSYSYDDRGLLLSCFTEVDSWEVSIFKYKKFDSYGNWIERERQYIGLSTGVSDGEDPTYKGNEIETREIVYF